MGGGGNLSRARVVKYLARSLSNLASGKGALSSEASKNSSSSERATTLKAKETG